MSEIEPTLYRTFDAESDPENLASLTFLQKIEGYGRSICETSRHMLADGSHVAAVGLATLSMGAIADLMLPTLADAQATPSALKGQSSITTQRILNEIYRAIRPLSGYSALSPGSPDPTLPVSANLSASQGGFHSQGCNSNYVAYKYYEITPWGRSFQTCIAGAASNVQQSTNNEFSGSLNRIDDQIIRSAKPNNHNIHLAAEETAISVSGTRKQIVARYQCLPPGNSSNLNPLNVQAIKLNRLYKNVLIHGHRVKKQYTTTSILPC